MKAPKVMITPRPILESRSRWESGLVRFAMGLKDGKGAVGVRSQRDWTW